MSFCSNGIKRISQVPPREYFLYFWVYISHAWWEGNFIALHSQVIDIELCTNFMFLKSEIFLFHSYLKMDSHPFFSDFAQLSRSSVPFCSVKDYVQSYRFIMLFTFIFHQWFVFSQLSISHLVSYYWFTYLSICCSNFTFSELFLPFFSFKFICGLFSFHVIPPLANKYGFRFDMYTALAFI